MRTASLETVSAERKLRAPGSAFGVVPLAQNGDGQGKLTVCSVLIKAFQLQAVLLAWRPQHFGNLLERSERRRQRIYRKQGRKS